MLDLALLDEVFDGAGDVFDGDVQVDAVLVVEIDGVDLEALQRLFGDFLDVIRMAVEGVPFAAVVGVGFPAEFCGDDDLTAEGREGFADELFIEERAVDFGGIEEGDAAIDGFVEELDHLLLVFSGAVGPAHAHAAETEGGDLKIAVA